jgi:hypothetical protein
MASEPDAAPAQRSETLVATTKPSAYLKQLCRHFGHKVPVTFDDDHGRIEFDFGTCELSRQQDALLLGAWAPTSDELERVEQVIASHLERFGRRDELQVIWPA